MEAWIAPGAAKFVAPKTLKALSVRSDVKGALQAASFGAAIAVTTTAIILIPASAILVLIPVLLIHGVLLNCLYAGQHEMSHWTAFRTRRLNDLFGHLFGLVTLNPFLTDRWMHFAHHRSTQDARRDPELMGMKPYSRASYAMDLIGIDFWRRRVWTIITAAAGLGLESAWWLGARERRLVIWEARAHVAIWGVIAMASLALRSGEVVLFWIGPLFATKGFHQLQNTGEHTGMPQTPDIFVNTRTLTGPAALRWLMWNMSYHTAHHAYPATPFHALPRLHAEILRNLPHKVPTLGYIAAQKAIFESLRT
jgi:fatty acid desaturase